MPSLSLDEIYRRALVKAFHPEKIHFQEAFSAYDDVQQGVAFFSGKLWVDVINDADSFRTHDDLINLLNSIEDKISILPIYLYFSAIDSEPDTEFYGLMNFLQFPKVKDALTSNQRSLIIFCLATLVARKSVIHNDLLPVLDRFMNGAQAHEAEVFGQDDLRVGRVGLPGGD